MKPSTKLEKRVFELSSKLPKITEKKASWGYKFLDTKHYGRKTNKRKTIVCFECAHSWKDDVTGIYEWHNEIVKPICPNCNKELKLTTDSGIRQIEYITVLDYREDFQIVRLVIINKYLSKGELPRYTFSEVMQHWIRTDGRITIMAKDANTQSYDLDSWCLWGKMSIKIATSNQAEQRLNLYSSDVVPRQKIHPILKRNGFKTLFPKLRNHEFISFIMSDTRAETLLKSGQIEMFVYFAERRQNLEVFWDSIKICIRNNYKPKDVGIWYDYMMLLSFFNKDVRSPKYVCPVDLKLEHDRLVNKKREFQKKQRLMEMKARIETSQLQYESNKKDFFGLEFTNEKKNISIRFIETIKDFIKEGDELKHCVFTNEYYEKNNSLIFSAYVKNKRTETIEFKLDSMKVSQSRGLGNKSTKYHSEILKLINSNIPLIRKRLKKNKKTKAIA